MTDAHAAGDDALQIRLRQQAAVAELGQRALMLDDLDAFLADASSLIAEHLDVEFVKLLERLPGGHELLLRAGVGWRPGLVGTEIIAGGDDSQAGHALRIGELQIVEDLATDRRFRSPLLT